MTTPLPSGWAAVRLGEVAEASLGKMLDRGRQSNGLELRYLRNQNVRWDAFELTDVFRMRFAPSELERFSLRPGDLVVCEGGEPGRCAIWDGRESPMMFQKALHRVRLLGGLDGRFLLHHLRWATRTGRLSRYVTGTTIKHFTGRSLDRFLLNLPPLMEQRRIAERIDVLFAHSKKAKESLDRIPPLLEKLKKAILAAAFRGDLTKDWREAHPDVEPADQLLERIRAERRRRWEEAELARMRAKGQEPKDDRWKERYKAAYQLSRSEILRLPPLPSGWLWASWDELSERVTVGHVGSMKDEYVLEGVPFLRSQNVRANRFDPDGLCFVSEAFNRKLPKSALKPGDLLVVRSGSVGVTCVVPEWLKESNCSDLVIIKQPLGVLPAYGAAFMNSIASTTIRAGQVGVALNHFNTGSVARLAVPVAPMAEQVGLTEILLSALGQIERLAAALERMDQRRKALEAGILAKAFRGELVPQDPNDEPASVLLERIRAGRAAVEAENPKRTRNAGGERIPSEGPEKAPRRRMRGPAAGGERISAERTKAFAQKPRRDRNSGGEHLRAERAAAEAEEPTPELAANAASGGVSGTIPASPRPHHLAASEPASPPAAATSTPVQQSLPLEAPAQPSLPLDGPAFLDAALSDQARAVADALFGLGALPKDDAIRAAAEVLREAGLLRFKRLRSDGPFYAAVEAALDAAIKTDLVDRPKRGLVRCLRADLASYRPEDWHVCLAAALAAGPLPDEDALRAAAGWAQEHAGLGFERFRRGGKLHTALGAALESALSGGILERLPDGRVGARS